MATIKRERCINWEKEEKQLFRNILRPYLHIIESKDLCNNTNKEKLRAWSEITEKFNLANVRARNKKQLINQWKCIKLNSKKELSSYKRETSKTGGGPKPPSPSPETMEVVDMIPQEFEVDYNMYDCDGLRDITNDIIIEKIDIEEKAKPNIGDDKVVSAEIIKDIGKKIEYLVTPKKSTKRTPKPDKDHFNFQEASYADMHNFRILENERLQKEQEVRMANMNKIHSQVMTNLKLQTQILTKALDLYKK